jgi:hypothetical protein
MRHSYSKGMTKIQIGTMFDTTAHIRVTSNTWDGVIRRRIVRGKAFT